MEGILTTGANDEGCGPSWDYCPTDVLLEIFEFLPMSSLAVCMFVNETWRSQVQYVLKVKNKWKDFVNIVTNYNGIDLKTKWAISCDWEQVFYNYILWHNAEKATIKFQQVKEIGNIKNLHIFGDQLCVVTRKDVQYYDVKTLTKQRIMEVKCQDLREVDDMIIVVTETDRCLTLDVYQNSLDDGFNMNRNVLFTVENVMSYTIHDKHCYYHDIHNSLYSFNGTFLFIFNARFYGNCSSLNRRINIFNNHVHLLCNDLRKQPKRDKEVVMLWVDPNRRNFNKMIVVKEPPEKLGKTDHQMFYWYCQDDYQEIPTQSYAKKLAAEGLMKGLDIDRQTCYNPQNETIVFVYTLRNVSCMLQHGDLLFLGYWDGLVEIISPRHSLNFGRIHSFKLEDLMEDIVDTRIQSMDVLEEETIQHLFVATTTYVFHLHFTHEDSDKYMWNDEACRKSVLPTWNNE